MKKILLLLLLLFVAVPTQTEGAIALVASVVAGSTDAGTITTAGVDTTGANLIVCVVAFDEMYDTSVSAVSDIKGNTWVGRTTRTVTGGVRIRTYYAVNPTVGSGHTFTADKYPLLPAIGCLAFSGANTSAPYDVENGTTATGVTSVQPGSVTPSEDNEVIVTGVASAQAIPTSAAINGGFTFELNNQGGTGVDTTLFVGYLIQTSAAAANPTWSWDAGDSRTVAVSSTTFKSTGVAGPTCRGALTLLGVGGC
jgi:hypothetical protein